MNKGFTIAIDGPVAAGKGTVALQLAKKLNGFYLYTGAMYRCVALYCLMNGVDINNGSSVALLLSSVTIRFEGERVFLNEQDVTERIKEPDVANGSSIVSTFPLIRKALVHKQQELARQYTDQGRIVISEGRDTGTVVFPDADLKIYLTATDEVRAKRRLQQFEQKNMVLSFQEVLAQVRERDARDTQRETDPLPSHPEDLDYVIVDDSQMTEEQTLQTIEKYVKERSLVG